MTDPQPKPLAEAREDRKELIANLKGLGQLSGPLGRATMLRAAARIDADGKFAAEIDRQDRLIDDLERRVSALSASPAPAPETDALRGALGLAEKALAPLLKLETPTRLADDEIVAIPQYGNRRVYARDTRLAREALAAIAALHTGGEGKGETDGFASDNRVTDAQIDAAIVKAALAALHTPSPKEDNGGWVNSGYTTEGNGGPGGPGYAAPTPAPATGERDDEIARLKRAAEYAAPRWITPVWEGWCVNDRDDVAYINAADPNLILRVLAERTQPPVPPAADAEGWQADYADMSLINKLRHALEHIISTTQTGNSEKRARAGYLEGLLSAIADDAREAITLIVGLKDAAP